MELKDLLLEDLKGVFAEFPNWEEKYSFLIDLGKKLPAMEDNLKIDENRVPGCTSRLWFVLEHSQGKITVKSDGDSSIIKGILSIIYILINDKTAQEVSSIDFKCIFKDLGLDENISSNRRSSLTYLPEIIKTFSNKFI